MNREYTPVQPRTRVLLALASALLSTVVLGAVVGLAGHYGDQVHLAQVTQQVDA